MDDLFSSEGKNYDIDKKVCFVHRVLCTIQNFQFSVRKQQNCGKELLNENIIQLFLVNKVVREGVMFKLNVMEVNILPTHTTYLLLIDRIKHLFFTELVWGCLIITF